MLDPPSRCFGSIFPLKGPTVPSSPFSHPPPKATLGSARQGDTKILRCAHAMNTCDLGRRRARAPAERPRTRRRGPDQSIKPYLRYRKIRRLLEHTIRTRSVCAWARGGEHLEKKSLGGKLDRARAGQLSAAACFFIIASMLRKPCAREILNRGRQSQLAAGFCSRRARRRTRRR